MTQPTATNCLRCGVMLPYGAGASAAGLCPACGQASDPTGAASARVVAVDMPTRLPLAPLALLATLCAVMGLALGVWLGWRHSASASHTEVQLPALPPLGRPLPQPLPAPRIYPVPASSPARPALPPASIAPPFPGQSVGVTEKPPVQIRPLAPSPRRPVSPAPRPLIAPEAPLKAPGMATVRVNNPSAAAIDVTLSGSGRQTGVVGPRASVDFLIPPGRYEIALHGAARTQHFYDAPLAEGDVLSLVYSDSARD